MVKARLQDGLESANQLFDLNMKMLARGIEAKQDGKNYHFHLRCHIKRCSSRITLYTPENDFCIKDDAGNLAAGNLFMKKNKICL